MIYGPDGKPLRREALIESGSPLRVILEPKTQKLQLSRRLSVYGTAGWLLLSQTNFWISGGTVVWIPAFDGSVKEIVWASPDLNQPVPDWVYQVPAFTLTTAFLTSASSSPWATPGGVSTTKAECVGEGGNGFGALGTAGGGGGGGGFGKQTSLAVSSNVNFQIGSGGTATTTWFSASGTVRGDFGVSAVDNLGASGGTSNVGDQTQNGGNGHGTVSGVVGGGGGGAAGFDADGGNSGGSAGGAGDGGNDVGGSGGGAGSNGGNGTKYDASHGFGGGGGGGNGGNAGNGGLYGGGGGGEDAFNDGTFGTGASGLIALTYVVAISIGWAPTYPDQPSKVGWRKNYNMQQTAASAVLVPPPKFGWPPIFPDFHIRTSHPTYNKENTVFRLSGPNFPSQSLLVSDVAVASFVRSTTKLLLGNNSAIASLVRSVAKSLSVVNVAVVSMTWAATRTLLTSSAAVASLVEHYASNIALNANNAALASLSHAFGKVVQANSALQAKLVRSVSIPLQVSSAALASLGRTLSKALLTSTGAVSSLQLVTSKTLRASNAAVAAVFRTIPQLLRALNSAIASLVKGNAHQVYINANASMSSDAVNATSSMTDNVSRVATFGVST